MSAIQILFTFVISSVVYHLYVTNVISETYQIQRYSSEKAEYYSSSKGDNNATLSSIIESDHNFDSNDPSNKKGNGGGIDSVTPKKSAKSMKEYLKGSKRYISKQPNRQQLYILYKLLLGRE